MNSIISPWVFYWISISDNVRMLLISVIIILLIGLAIVLAYTMCDADDYGSKSKNVDRDVKRCKNLYQDCNRHFYSCGFSLCGS